MAPGPDRWKERSRTYEGIAQAMAAQWGTSFEAAVAINGGGGPESSPGALPTGPS
jgi:hypothetical protein